MKTAVADSPATLPSAFAERRRTADCIFKGALIFNAALTVFWVVMLAAGGNAVFFREYDISREALMRIFSTVLFALVR